MKSLKTYTTLVEERLETIIPELAEDSFVEGDLPSKLAESMRYSLLAGGKRLRPGMFLACMDVFGADWKQWIDFACAIEMIHSYSLIHDDLPGMDNDTLRRGKPTNHVVFGVGQAILAGDGLLNLAFETMLATVIKNGGNAEAGLQAVLEIATGCGVTGMIAGQVIDLQCENNRHVSQEALSYIHRNKTACMFIYPLKAAAILSGADKTEIEAIANYGEAFGRMFQAADDLLDVTGDTEQMGKTLGKDAEQGKLTAISIYGLEGTKELIERLHQNALLELNRIDRETDFFRDLIDSMIGRNN